VSKNEKREKKQHFLYPKIVAKKQTFVDLRTFLRTVLHNELHERIAQAIIEYLAEHGEAYLRDLIPFIREKKQTRHNKAKDNREVVVSKDTIAKVFKSTWKSGLTSKKMRYDPVKLSKTFCLRLRDLADYWQNYVEQYN